MGAIIFGTQIFLAYKSLNLSLVTSIENRLAEDVKQMNGALALQHLTQHQNSASDDEDSSNLTAQGKRLSPASNAKTDISPTSLLSAQQLSFKPNCDIIAKEAISALQRAKTKDCRQHIASVVCAIQAGEFYASHLPTHCPKGNHTANNQLGCYRDEKEFRLLSGYFINFKTTNTPKNCVQLCLQSGFPYAGVEYSRECFCGTDAPPSTAKLPDSSCSMKCSGNTHEVCGGYYAINIYETGIASK